MPLNVTIGSVFDAIFHENRIPDHRYPLRATRLAGQRAPKVVLSQDARIRSGRPCRARIASIHRGSAAGRGFYVAEYAGEAALELPDGLYVDPVVRRRIGALLDAGRSILLDGPQGSGKTLLARSIAQALGMEFVYFHCASVFEATDFVASLQLRATPAGATETVWLPSTIRRAISAAAGAPASRVLIFLDELNRCREMARNGIMPALDATRRLYDPLEGDMLVIPDNVQWIAAVNSGARFTGTTPIDAAHLDRFAPVRVDYPPPAEEVRIIAPRYPSLAKELVERVVRAANAVRRAPAVEGDLSVRATDEACLLLTHPQYEGGGDAALEEVLRATFCARFEGSPDDHDSQAGLVWSAVKRALSWLPSAE